MVSNKSGDNQSPVSRIRPDDVLIKRPVVQEIMGGISVSSVYDDPDLMRLKVCVTPIAKSPHAVAWIKRGIHELRAQRVARSEAKAAAAQAQIEQRRGRRTTRKTTGETDHPRT